MRAAEHWKDFEVLDTSGGEKLERWGDVILARPDPQIIWNTPKGACLEEDRCPLPPFPERRRTAGKCAICLPSSWTIGYRELTFKIQPTGFKHTGLFPEQAVNWDFMAEKIRTARKKDPDREIKVLNLFAYTGGATTCLQRRQARRSAMWTPPRAWWPGPGKTRPCPGWRTVPSAGSWTTA